MKKHKLTYKTGIMLLISVLFLTCGKEVEKIAQIDQESKEYCMYDWRSYWIYQDATTLKIDSVYTDIGSSSEQYKYTPASQKNLYRYEEIKTTFQYYLLCDFHHDGSHILTSMYCNVDSVIRNIMKPVLNKSVNGIDKTYINVASTHFNYHNGSILETVVGLLYENYYESYQIENHTFSKVKVFLYSFHNSSHQIRTYWAKNVGIIRTEYINEDTCAIRNLIRYNVKHYQQ
jgi:hypothetical protein